MRRHGAEAKGKHLHLVQQQCLEGRDASDASARGAAMGSKGGAPLEKGGGSI
jgi:hypothetical protein